MVGNSGIEEFYTTLMLKLNGEAVLVRETHGGIRIGYEPYVTCIFGAGAIRGVASRPYFDPARSGLVVVLFQRDTLQSSDGHAFFNALSKDRLTASEVIDRVLSEARRRDFAREFFRQLEVFAKRHSILLEDDRDSRNVAGKPYAQLIVGPERAGVRLVAPSGVFLERDRSIVADRVDELEVQFRKGHILVPWKVDAESERFRHGRHSLTIHEMLVEIQSVVELA